MSSVSFRLWTLRVRFTESFRRSRILNLYDADSLARLRDELKVSVQRRIEVTVQKGSDFGHAERQTAEQQLIKSIDMHLGNR